MSAVAKQAQSQVTVIDAGECQLIGPERFLIPEGEYEALFTHYETAPLFIKNVRGTHEGGKVFCWFRIDPYKNSQLIDPREDVRLFISYNASSLQIPYGKNGRFNMTRGKKFVKDFERLIGTAKRRDRIYPSNFKDKLLKVQVHTVTRDKEQKDYSERSHYSVVDEILEILAGTI